MKIVEGNLLDMAVNGDFDVIIHGCNCFCNMGAGIALQIMERRARLFGLDAPTKVANTDPTGTKEAISSAVQMTPEQLMEEAAKRGLPIRIFEE